jgi:hypothetical protein
MIWMLVVFTCFACFDDALFRGAAHLVFTLLTNFGSDSAVGGHVRWALTVSVFYAFVRLHE